MTRAVNRAHHPSFEARVSVSMRQASVSGRVRQGSEPSSQEQGLPGGLAALFPVRRTTRLVLWLGAGNEVRT